MAKNEPKTVLIVEDEPSLNEAYQIILTNAGYNILAAYNGEEALMIVKDVTPDVILLDLRMPVMDGIEFLHNYSLADNDKTKVIVFSNYDMQKEIEEAYKLGANKYILKAWASPNELLKLVKDVIQDKS
jgi:CheY-like chemotaxis protein